MKISFLFSLFLLLSLTGTALSEDSAQLPEGLKIIPPASNVPPRIANYSGIWEGRWLESRQEVKIAIVEINPPDVKAIRAWGFRKGQPAGWKREKGTIVGDDKLLLTGRNSELELTPTDNPDIIRAEITVVVDPWVSKVGVVRGIADLKRLKK